MGDDVDREVTSKHMGFRDMGFLKMPEVVIITIIIIVACSPPSLFSFSTNGHGTSILLPAWTA
jgi:hypothetical protein